MIRRRECRREARDPHPGSEPAYGRRAFLVVVAGGVSSLWWADGAVRLLGDLARPVVDLLPEDVRRALPAPSSGWRIYAVNPPFPRVVADRWRLRIDGLVQRPLTLSLRDLQDLPQTRYIRDFHCVTGWSVRDVRWGGVRLAAILDAARPAPMARAVTFTSIESPYRDALSLRDARNPDVLLATTMDERPLTRPHGAPVRVVIPQMYGYKGVKWLARITVTARQATGYWERRGYDRDAWVDGSNRDVELGRINGSGP